MVEKIEPGTPDGTEENIERLATLFPQVVTEVADGDGTLRHVVDFDALRALLGDAAEGQRERYQFTWPGKAAARAEARRPIRKTMRPEKGRSVGWDTTGNLYIEGDNLDALKLLKETYAGKVKMVYIDPPYNTGHDFVYDDDFAQGHGEYEGQSGDWDEAGGRLVANPDSNGRFHSDWCSMIYPRLALARDLLSADGVVFVSIDDNECANLTKICDELFPRGFLNRITWVSNLKGRQIGTSGAAKCTESILVYAKDPDRAPALKGHVEQLKRLMPSLYKGLDYQVHEDELGPYVVKNELYNSNSAFNEETRPNLVFDIGWNPETGEVRTYDCDAPVDPGFARIRPHASNDGTHRYHAWRWSRRKVLAESRELHFQEGADGGIRVYTKVRDYDVTALKDVMGGLSTSTGVADLSRLFDGIAYFDFPKPVDLLQVLMRSCTARGDIVLDFFSGSATTAEALFRLEALDGTPRHFILVQLPEATAGGSRAQEDGYQTICDIGEERIRRAGAKVRAEVDEANRQLGAGEEPRPVPDVGFRVLRIDSSNMRDVYRTPDETSQMDLLSLADNVEPGRSPEDLLFEVLPKFRIPYSARIETRELGGRECFLVDHDADAGTTRLVACFDTEVGTETIEEMAELGPDYAVVRDASLADDATQANFEELFKTHSPSTVRRVF